MGMRSERKEWFFVKSRMVEIMQQYFDTILFKNANWKILEFLYDEEKDKFVVIYRMEDREIETSEIVIIPDRPKPFTITIRME